MCCRRHLMLAHRRGGILFTLCGVTLFLAFAFLILFLVFGAFNRYQMYLDERENTVPKQVEVETIDDIWNRITQTKITLGDREEADHSQGDSAATSVEESVVEAPRPDWVDKPPKRVGDVYRAVVASDPFSTVDECFDQLEHRFPEEVRRRLTKLVPSDQRSLVGSESLQAAGVTLDYIMREICREQFTETTEHDFGAMKKVYVLMEFTPAIESRLLDRWQTSQRRYRLTMVAQIAGSVLAALAIVYGLLQIDTWTRGYYTRRLLLGVPAAIIAIVVVVLYVS